MYANGKRNVITKETLKWQLSVSVGNKGLFNGANSIHLCECERTDIRHCPQFCVTNLMSLVML